MFESIQKGLGDALKKLRGRGRITEGNIRDGLMEVRRALLDADVNFNVANDFIKRVTEKSVGQEVLRSVNPSEQIVRVMYEEFVALMGPVDHSFKFAKDRPTVIMLCGLQGSGKTTTAGKLALTLKEQNRKPLLVAADLQRPAAIDQLKVLGEQIGIPVYAETGSTPLDVCRNAIAHAKKTVHDTIILDTAGRLHVDDMPMKELKEIDKAVRPDDVYLVVDSMTGQDAVNSAKAFNDALDLNGVILTKLDGDTRGGAALSIKEITKVPIKFVGVGEKLDRLEEFHPERMAQRIMGQGDLMGLIEKVGRIQQELTQEEIEKQQKKLEQGDFNLDDFRKQFPQLAKVGGVKSLMQAMPGMEAMFPEGEDPEDGMRHIQGIIDSMTMSERRNPDLIDINRRRRIAAGSGSEPHEIKQLLQQFEQVRTMMRQMAKMSMWERVKMITGMGQSGAFAPGAKLAKTKIGTGHRKSAKERADERKKKKNQGRRGR